MCLGLMTLFGSKKLDWAGAGPLAALTLPFVAALRWRTEFKQQEKVCLMYIYSVSAMWACLLVSNEMSRKFLLCVLENRSTACSVPVGLAICLCTVFSASLQLK